MRKLIVTRGLPGSGKSYTLNKLGLADFTLGADTLRLLLSSPVLTQDGRMALSHDQESKVWSQMFEILGHRMARGETTVMDATHPTSDEFKNYIKLARLHRYEIACLDFSKVPADMSNWLNDGRAEHRVVPKFAVDRINAKMAEGKVPNGIHRVMVRSDLSHIAEMQNWLEIPIRDLAAEGYSRVMAVGDIQGCHTAAQSLLEGGLRDDTFYVFVGDACDRGDENGSVMRWLIDDVIERENVCFLWGNHEDHLHKEALELPPVSSEFAGKSLPQLHAAGVTREELDRFCSKLQDMFLYTFCGQKVMVTHAGLSTVPKTPWMLSARQCAHGTGYYEDDVDGQFDRHGPKGWIQVHGHRNHHHLDSKATPRSFNLEASVEAGGHIRGLIHDTSGLHPVEAANPLFRPFRLRRHHRMTIVPPWMKRDEEGGTIMPQALRDAMANHPLIRAKASVAFPHVSALNFTKQAFYDKEFDEVSVKARGLFVNTESGEIVSRSYDKFFNVGERPETCMDALKEKFVFPLTAWVKENGYIGILGYDKQTDSLFASSKSTPDGDFAGWFKDILFETVPSRERREALKRFLRDTESTMAFEVIDTVNDAVHMVEYETSKLVLLDVVRRSTEFERLPYPDLERVGKDFSFEVKQKEMVFKDWKSFEGWRRAAMSNMKKKIEGYVLEDANGYMTKEKLPWYSFWKLARGMKDAVVREREGGKPVKAMQANFLETRGIGFTAPLGAEFLEWCRGQNTEFLRDTEIIDLRKAFENPEPTLTHSL